MGQHDLANYTIEADVQLTEKEGKLPDVGLINSRYTLTLVGEYQELRIESWGSHDYRHHAKGSVQLEPGKWYSMKFSVTPAEGQAIARGKFWPKDEPEPDAWTLELVDTAPNLQGSPGLFGNTQNSEFYLDNITVTPN
jgi:hypothetical protein